MDNVVLMDLLDALMEQPLSLSELLESHDLPKTKCNIVFP